MTECFPMVVLNGGLVNRGEVNRGRVCYHSMGLYGLVFFYLLLKLCCFSRNLIYYKKIQILLFTKQLRLLVFFYLYVSFVFLFLTVQLMKEDLYIRTLGKIKMAVIQNGGPFCLLLLSSLWNNHFFFF